MKRLIVVALLASIAAGAKGCSVAGEATAQVCAKKSDFTRSTDDKCEQSADGYRWRYYRGSVHIPAVGKKLKEMDGSWMKPQTKSVRIPEGGGTANEVAGGK